MTPAQRSRCMSRIRGKNTKPELLLRKSLWSAGYRYRVHYKITGKPDITFPGKRVAVFVDGCFWHGCPVHANKPRNNAEFWETKLAKTIDRDRVVTKELTQGGWLVLRFWEHSINQDLDAVTQEVINAVNSR